MEGIKTDAKGRFVKGTAGGPGRPPGSISPITKVKQIFEENPEKFAAFLETYMSDPSNAKHIVEMIDGKPQQDITSKGERIIPTPIADVSQYNGVQKDSEPEEAN